MKVVWLASNTDTFVYLCHFYAFLNQCIQTLRVVSRSLFGNAFVRSDWSSLFDLNVFTVLRLLLLLCTYPSAINHTVTNLGLEIKELFLCNCALPDDGPVRAETCSSWRVMPLLWLWWIVWFFWGGGGFTLCNRIIMLGMENVKSFWNHWQYPKSWTKQIFDTISSDWCVMLMLRGLFLYWRCVLLKVAKCSLMAFTV